MTVTSTVRVRGKDYTINSFSDCHIATLSNLLKDTSNLQYQFDAGFILKEIILPDLPYDVIRENTKGDKYIFMIHAREISDLLICVLRFYYESEIERLTTEGNTTLVEQFKTNLEELGKKQPQALSDKDKEIAKLKSQLAEKTVNTIDVTAQSEKDEEIAKLKKQLANTSGS